MLKYATLCAVMTSTLFSDSASAVGSGFSGEWSYLEFIAESRKPYSVLKIRLNAIGHDALTGSYCFITQGGNRIDCDPNGVDNISGKIDKNGRHAKIQFASFLGAKAGTAYLEYQDDILIWKVENNPTGAPFYGPYAVTLRRERSDAHLGERQVVVDKAYLHAKPVKSKVRIYLVRDDFVELVKISDDLKSWNVTYSGKDGRKTDYWLDCDAIDFCPPAK